MPKVSVIIPVFHVENYLRDCLDSIVNQTLHDIEIICVNDASPDNSAMIIEEYRRNDSRIKVITHEYNQGLGPARNTGISIATSPYISFIDSDDYISTNMLEDLLESITLNHADIAWCGMAAVSEEKQIIDAGQIPPRNWSIPEVLNCELLYPSILSLCNKLYDRNLVKDFKQLPIVMEDQPALADYFIHCNKIVTTNNSKYYYRKRTSTLSNPKNYSSKDWNDFFYSHNLFLNTLKKKYPQPGELKKQSILRSFSILWRINAFRLLNANSWKEQEKTIVTNLVKNGIQLKESCPVMYQFLLFTLKYNWPTGWKSYLIKTGLKLSRGAWLNHCSYWSLPFQLTKIILPQLKIQLINGLYFIEINFFKSIAGLYKTLNHQKIWLVGERTDTAQENGFFFYKYLKTKQPQEKSYYVINKRSKQYNLVKEYGRVIDYNSWKHKVFFFACTNYVTAHNHYCFPSTRFGNRKMLLPSSSKNVFIPHGVTYLDSSEYYGKKISGISLFICAGRPEYEYIKRNYGYSQNEVKYTGFSRFDGYYNIDVKRQILIMPTWRWDICYISKGKTKVSDDFFKSTLYYQIFQYLLNNSSLIEILNHNNYQMVFYPHYEIQRFLHCFSSNSEKVTIASKDDFVVQDLLKESALLITDTSSVSFDFAYMLKPVIYYFFDVDSFSKTHLKLAYFNHERMGFGEIARSEESLIKMIECHLKNSCLMVEKYRKRVDRFFPLKDHNNSERIYDAIINTSGANDK